MTVYEHPGAEKLDGEAHDENALAIVKAAYSRGIINKSTYTAVLRKYGS